MYLKYNKVRKLLLYSVISLLSLLTLFSIALFSWIGFEIKKECNLAKSTYAGDCVEASMMLLEDNNQSFYRRNSAIWTLGQLGDSRALPVLQRYYTGIIPEREPLDQSISQYELKKAINLTSGGVNLTAFFWRNRFFRN